MQERRADAQKLECCDGWRQAELEALYEGALATLVYTHGVVAHDERRAPLLWHDERRALSSPLLSRELSSVERASPLANNHLLEGAESRQQYSSKRARLTMLIAAHTPPGVMRSPLTSDT